MGGTEATSALGILSEKMKLLLLFLLAFLLSHETGADEIIGGKESKPYSHPYMAFLEIKNHGTQYYCGGFLIQRDFVMTAAHCAGRFITVTLGTHNISKTEATSQTFNVKQQFPHPDYNPQIFANDIMLLKLEEKAKLTVAVGTLPLPSISSSTSPGEICQTTGWGKIGVNDPGSDILQEVKLRLMDPINCKVYHFFNEKHQLCVGNPKSIKAAYRGDSGGPLICSGVAQGIVSYGRRDARPPSVFTKIAYYLPWINQILKSN
ncbi:chymase-like [Dromiciops gliroides]|uniref:chymase-like n=1 Tax=Dromiciops gliroides TaxID=33562 RepID=UPI001CC39D92|nr:chymase-like [Dromiciops gliroides]